MRSSISLVPVAIASILILVGPVTVALPSSGPGEASGPSRPGAEPPASAAEGADDAGPPGSPVTLPGAEQFDLRSKSGLEYRIFVAGPTGEVPEPGSPVIYLSDGNSNFPVLLAAARQRSRDDPRAVVVGIGYPGNDGQVHRERRAFDLTPLASGGPPPAGFPEFKSGGNDQFLAFIEEELKPVIERRYRIDRHRQALFGHSFGGLFVLHVLFSAPESFQTYLASSPSLWWDDGGILSEEDAFLETYADRTVEARLLISVGEWEQSPGPGVSLQRREVLARRQMAGNAEELAARLTATRIEGLTVKFLQFDEEEHGSVVLPAASRGVRFAIDE